MLGRAGPADLEGADEACAVRLAGDDENGQGQEGLLKSCLLEQNARLNRIYIMENISETTSVVSLIHSVRGQRVIFDSDLARLYGVSTKRLNEQVRRNPDRFPKDFAFILSKTEIEILRSQFATSSWGGRRYLTLVFTEHGAIMAANVLNSRRAVAMSVEVVRAFIRLRHAAVSQGIAARKLAELEHAVNARLDQHDKDIEKLFDTVESLISSNEVAEPHKQIGFLP